MAYDSKALSARDAVFDKQASARPLISEEAWQRIGRIALMVGILIFWQFHFS